MKEIRPAALGLKIKLEEIDAQLDAKGLESAFQTAKQKQVGAIMTTTAIALFRRKKARSSSLPSNTDCPLFIPQKEFVDAGGLMSYGADYD